MLCSLLSSLFVISGVKKEKTKANEDVLKGQTVQVIGLGKMGLLAATSQMRAAGCLRPSAAHASLCT